MEDDRRTTPKSDEKSPDASPEISSSDFEFGSLTPSSPSHSEHSPADHLFLNGRLLPHTFPMTRSVSRTTSENTFRSSSTSSRSSDSSSSPTSFTPRTSTCSSVFKEETNLTCFGSRSEKTRSVRSGTCSMRNKSSSVLDLKKKPPTNNGKRVNTTTKNKISHLHTQCKRKKATEIVTAQLYGSYTRRWQHITPVFKREGSVKSNGGGIKVGGKKKKKKTVRGKKKKTEERRGSKLMKWWKRVIKAVLLACRECHAMEPQRVVNYDADVKEKITKCS
ncbi:hypothetical protein Bca4012_063753 [Brassica carinata]|uniref:Uncharacterized protein n=1 Tax=Brassica carinata TaxID=52824 RepID=A0A8X7V9C3_BRACI|nr:hypothetical protein Bca52824_033352 [Brassica carinata]